MQKPMFKEQIKPSVNLIGKDPSPTSQQMNKLTFTTLFKGFF